MTSEYVMRIQTLRKLQTIRGEILRCRRCGEPILPDQKVVSHRSTRTGKFKIYHETCYEMLFLDL